MNRDYFTKPSQGGGRNHPEYGRFTVYRKPPRDPWMKPTLISIGVIAIYFAWQFSRHLF